MLGLTQPADGKGDAKQRLGPDHAPYDGPRRNDEEDGEENGRRLGGDIFPEVVVPAKGLQLGHDAAATAHGAQHNSEEETGEENKTAGPDLESNLDL